MVACLVLNNTESYKLCMCSNEFLGKIRQSLLHFSQQHIYSTLELKIHVSSLEICLKTFNMCANATYSSLYICITCKFGDNNDICNKRDIHTVHSCITH